MNSVNYDVPLVHQGASECLQASVCQLLNYLKIPKKIAEVKKEVPVYKNASGELLGTSIGHSATYLLTFDLRVKIHTVDVEIFDRSWSELSIAEISKKLRLRKEYVRHHRYDTGAMNYIIDGYTQFISNGGEITFPIIDERYLSNLLLDGPFIALTSSNFLHQTAKANFPTEKNSKSMPDSIKGSTFTHAIVVSGYDNGSFSIVDPLPEMGGKRNISSSLLIGSIYLAETDFDPMLITAGK